MSFGLEFNFDSCTHIQAYSDMQAHSDPTSIDAANVSRRLSHTSFETCSLFCSPSSLKGRQARFRG